MSAAATGPVGRTETATGRRRPAVLVAVAIVGVGVSTYLAAYQLGRVTSVWDPLFGTGSERVLTSTVSRLLPVPDAAVGAVGYAIDLVLGLVLLIAGERAPVAVAVALGLVAGAGAVVAGVLIVLQPLVARSLCSLCLTSAALSIALAIGAVTEARDRLGGLDPA